MQPLDDALTAMDAWPERPARGRHACAGALAVPIALAILAVCSAPGFSSVPDVRAAPALSGEGPLVQIVQPAGGATMCAGKAVVKATVSATAALVSEQLTLDDAQVSFATQTQGPADLTLTATVSVAPGIHTLAVTAQDANGTTGSQTLSFTAVTCPPGQSTPGAIATPGAGTPASGGTRGGHAAATPSAGPQNPNPSRPLLPLPTDPESWLYLLALFLLAILVLVGLVAVVRFLVGDSKNGQKKGSQNKGSQKGQAPAHSA
jgi:hypothetical protein